MVEIAVAVTRRIDSLNKKVVITQKSAVVLRIKNIVPAGCTGCFFICKDSCIITLPVEGDKNFINPGRIRSFSFYGDILVKLLIRSVIGRDIYQYGGRAVVYDKEDLNAGLFQGRVNSCYGKLSRAVGIDTGIKKKRPLPLE